MRWARDDQFRLSPEAGEHRSGKPAWLAEPLPRHPGSDLDQAALARHLGRPEPVTAHDVLDLLVAAGVFEAHGNGYRMSATAPGPQDVLGLSAERGARVEVHDLERFRCFPSDLLVVALWGGTEQTATALAERTPASEADVRDTLEWAHRTGLLQVEGVLTGEFTMTVPG